MTGLEGMEEADIEEEIRRELEALNNLELKDIEHDSEIFENKDLTTNLVKNEEIHDTAPDSVEAYIKLLQSRNIKLEDELTEAQDALQSSYNPVIKPSEKTEENNEEISTEVKEKVLMEIAELDTNDKNTQDQYDTDYQISSLEELGINSLKELERKQHLKNDRLENIFNEIKEEEISRKQKEETIREQNKRKADEEYKMKTEENQTMKLKLEEEAKSKQRQLKDLEKKLEIEMKDMETRQEQERLALQKVKDEESEKRKLRKEMACITIQKNYRKFRVISKYGSTLRIKRKEREKQRQEDLEALERKEKQLMEEAVRKAKEDEERRLKEIEMEKERKRQEEERKRQEAELKKKMEIERKREEEEKKKLQEERMKREEEERKKREDEKRKKHEEEKKKRAEEEKKREEEKKMRDEQEKKAEAERKKREVEQEREKREAQEEARRDQEEKVRIKEEKRRVEETRMNEEEKRRKESISQDVWGISNNVGSRGIANESVVVKNDEHMKLQKYEMDNVNCKSEDRVSYQGKSSERNFVSSDEKNETVLSENFAKVGGESAGLSLEFETRREAWLRRTTPWSSLSAEENNMSKSRSRSRRPLSASQKLPSVSEEELAKSLKKFSSLEKVVYVNVKDLPARNLKIMLKCPNVTSVTVRNCGLLAVESFDNCKQLKELILADNCIHNVSCQNIESLEQLDLSNNQLTSIHGLNGCLSLQSLKLDGNKITRIGTSTSNKVMYFSIKNNQLITTKGLSQMKYVQTLDCSNNYLNQVEELGSCPLLRILRLQGNNLQKPPVLLNHVILREIHLSENSISFLEPLSDQWLPLLQRLYVDNNSLSNVSPLRGFPMLETLDVSNNLISDEENLIPGLVECHRLRNLRIHGNPVCEDTSVKTTILKTLPRLNTLDEERVGESLPNNEGIILFPIFQTQIRAQDLELEKHQVEMSKLLQSELDEDQVMERLTVQSRHFKELQDLVIKHRLEHENLRQVEQTNVADRVASETFKTVPDEMSTPQHTSSTVVLDRGGDKVMLKQPEAKSCVNDMEGPGFAIATKEPLGTQSNLKDTSQSENQKSKPVLKEQNVTPGVVSSTLPTKHLERGADNFVNNIWNESHHQAATLLQARFRGFRIRKRYLEATKASHHQDINLVEEDFNFDEEVDLTMFDMDEAALESSWMLDNSPQSLSRDPSRDNFPPTQQKQPTEEDNYRPFPPRHAWRSPDSPVSQYNQRKVIPPIDTPSTASEQTSISRNTTQSSQRTSELSSEWGFSKDVTVELMLKRANRMKYNALRKKKLNDPGKRFALFKKTDEANKARNVQPIPKKKEKERIDYFSGKVVVHQQSSGKNAPRIDEEEKEKEEMTFSWVYDQAVLHKDQSDDILRDAKGYLTEARPVKSRPERSPPVSLPRMDPVILAGRNLPLVASPAGNPRPSVSNSDHDSRSHPRLTWNQKTHSNPDLTRAGMNKMNENREKSNSADARIMRERNNFL